jgi:hypothetical protein
MKGLGLNFTFSTGITAGRQQSRSAKASTRDLAKPDDGEFIVKEI